MLDFSKGREEQRWVKSSLVKWVILVDEHVALLYECQLMYLRRSRIGCKGIVRLTWCH
jgi:hypothetical protein